MWLDPTDQSSVKGKKLASIVFKAFNGSFKVFYHVQHQRVKLKCRGVMVTAVRLPPYYWSFSCSLFCLHVNVSACEAHRLYIKVRTRSISKPSSNKERQQPRVNTVWVQQLPRLKLIHTAFGLVGDVDSHCDNWWSNMVHSPSSQTQLNLDGCCWLYTLTLTLTIALWFRSSMG